MKGNVILILLTSLVLILILISNINDKYKECILYSQNDITGYSEKTEESDNLINRKEAIKVANYVMRGVFDIDLNNENSQMFVNLSSRTTAKIQNYIWSIYWSKHDGTGGYGVEIDCNNGDIISAYVSEDLGDESSKPAKDLKDYEVIYITNEFAKKLDIDIDSYNLVVSDSIDYDYRNKKTKYFHYYPPFYGFFVYFTTDSVLVSIVITNLSFVFVLLVDVHTLYLVFLFL